MCKSLGLLKGRFILFVPIFDKNSKFYQTEILRVSQIFTIFVFHLKIIKKESKSKWIKLDESVFDRESFFPMQKILSIFQNSLQLWFINTHTWKSRPFTWLKQNSAKYLSWDQDNHTMFTKREGKGMAFDIFLGFTSVSSYYLNQRVSH